MKVLFIVPYSTEGASNRFRVEQYLPYLRTEGIDYDIRPFVFKRFYKIIYQKRQCAKKIIYFIIAFWRRILDIIRLHRYDAVFVHRECCPFGPPIFEWLIYIFGKPIIFDFDDAIFMQNFNPTNRIYRFLKFPGKTKNIIRMSSAVIVANNFLKEYATRFNNRVYVIPTPIDTDKFNVVKKYSGRLTIGWIGSPTTAPYLNIIFNVLQKLNQKYEFVLKLVGTDKELVIPGIEAESHEWQMEREVRDFQDIDIGVYPLPDTQWAYGKAAFKAIQYMSVGVPVVASPVGMTKELIKDGLNGFLAASKDEWIRKISKLIEDPELRKRIGLAGRATVEEKYSVEVNKRRYLEVIESVRKSCE